MPTQNRLRQRQRDEIHPLIRALDERLGHDQSNMQIAKATGLTNYQVGRLLGEYLPSPTYLDLTRLIVYAGMTPNEAARLVGLYDGPEQDADEMALLSSEERTLVKLLREVKLPLRERQMFRTMLESMLRAFAEQVAYQERQERQERQEPQNEWDRAQELADREVSLTRSSHPLYDGDETNTGVKAGDQRAQRAPRG